MEFGIDCGGGKIKDAHVLANGGNEDNYAVEFRCTSGTVAATDLTAEASGSPSRGFVKFGSGSHFTARNSVFRADSTGVDRNGGTVLVVSSEVDGPFAGGSITCVGVYDGAGVALTDGTTGAGGCATPP